jgi:Cu/Ag efflux pump CusA
MTWIFIWRGKLSWSAFWKSRIVLPLAPGLSWCRTRRVYLEGPHDNDPEFPMTETELMERRTLEDWVIRPLLKGLPDVVDANSIGGFVKQYQVMVDPGLLRKYDLALHDVFTAVANNNANAGGNILEKGPEKYILLTRPRSHQNVARH